MSSITSEFNDRTRRAYLSMAAFNADIFTYTTALNSTTYVVEGTLSAVSGATAGNCPQGRFLYENGRKLFPGANPGITTYMVGVFDPVSFLSGYIDPNSEKFTLMNTDKPVDQANSSNVFGTNPNGSTSDLAPPVFTRGDVIVGGNMAITGTTLIGGATTISTGGLTITAGGLTITDGKLNLDAVGTNASVGTGSMATGSIVGGFRRLTVNTSAVTAASKIFLTNVDQVNSGTVYSVESLIPTTSFQIVSNNTSDGSTINWLIIN